MLCIAARHAIADMSTEEFPWDKVRPHVKIRGPIAIQWVPGFSVWLAREWRTLHKIVQSMGENESMGLR